MISTSSATVQVGTHVHSILYGGRDGVVFNVRGEPGKSPVRSLYGGVIMTGGSASFDIVFTNGSISTGLPECILRGVQWRIYDEEPLATAEEITAMLDAAKATELARIEAARVAAEARKVEAAKLPGEFPFLTPVSAKPGVRNEKVGLANIRAHLKHAFPGIKFSVTCPRGYGTSIAWTMGPSSESVRSLLDRYKTEDFDGMQDCSISRDTVWPEVFGGTDSISYSRDVDTAKAVVMDAVAKLYELPSATYNTWVEKRDCSLGDVVHRILVKQSFPAGAVVTGIRWPDGNASEYEAVC